MYGLDIVTLKIIIFISLAGLTLGSYLVWPNKYNIPAHLQTGFVFTAYFIPLFATDIIDKFPKETIAFYAELVALGSIAYMFGIIVGFRLPLVRVTRWNYTFASSTSEVDTYEFVSKRVRIMTIIALSGIWISFAVMGFIPILAENPMQAKFFRGVYAEPYQRVAILYRFSFFMIVTIVPLLFAIWYKKREKLSNLFLGGASITTLLLTLSRGPALSGFLLFLGMVAIRKKVWFLLFFVFVFLIFPLGSLSYSLLVGWLGLGPIPSSDAFKMVANGAPDISDQLKFLSAFDTHGQLTYGKTFWGGLIPGHYRWNPSVWTLNIITGGKDINEQVSGGLRLVAPIFGYTAFSWPGAFLIPLISGLIMGNATRFARKYVEGNDFLMATVVFVLYLTLSIQLVNFYSLSMYSIPSIFAAALVAYRVRLSPNGWDLRTRFRSARYQNKR